MLAERGGSSCSPTALWLPTSRTANTLRFGSNSLHLSLLLLWSIAIAIHCSSAHWEATPTPTLTLTLTPTLTRTPTHRQEALNAKEPIAAQRVAAKLLMREYQVTPSVTPGLVWWHSPV